MLRPNAAPEGQDRIWCADEHDCVLDYLERENVRHGGVADVPSWFLVPYVAIWKVMSKKSPGSVGWWAISGNGPADYISSSGIKTARDAMRQFAREWHEVADCMLRGQPHPDTKIGTPDQWPELGKLLKIRANLLDKTANDNANWLPESDVQ